jgi:hypothetical protein
VDAVVRASGGDDRACDVVAAMDDVWETDAGCGAFEFSLRGKKMEDGEEEGARRMALRWRMLRVVREAGGAEVHLRLGRVGSIDALEVMQSEDGIQAGCCMENTREGWKMNSR